MKTQQQIENKLKDINYEIYLTVLEIKSTTNDDLKDFLQKMKKNLISTSKTLNWVLNKNK